MSNILDLLILIALQIVLSVDNLLYISLAAKNVPLVDRKKVITQGTLLAIVARIVLLFVLMYLVNYFKDPFFSLNFKYFEVALSVHSLIVLFGGAFIMYTGVKEIWHMLSPHIDEEKTITKSIKKIIISIVTMNMIFSFDSILSAMLITDVFWVMTSAIVVSGIMMLFLADKVSQFLSKNRTLEIGGLFLLLWVGIMLLSEGAHLAHLNVFTLEVHEIGKGNFYFVLAMLVIVFMVNNKYNKKIINKYDKKINADG